MSGYELDQRPVDVVVIGSQLVYGAVGNNTVARMIEASGHRCVSVPTVMLSNLPHYPSLAGGPVPEQWLKGYLEDLLAREVLGQTKYVFVGYLGQATQAEIIATWWRQARERHPQLQLILDPAMGDSDVGMYTEPDVAQAYDQQLVELAWLATPNNFELTLLSGQNIDDEQDAANACLDLLDRGCQHVLLTSAPTEDPAMIGCLLVVDEEEIVQLDTGRIQSTAKGAGDCFAGMLIGQLLGGQALEAAMEYAVSGTSSALSGTHELFAADHSNS